MNRKQRKCWSFYWPTSLQTCRQQQLRPLVSCVKTSVVGTPSESGVSLPCPDSPGVDFMNQLFFSHSFVFKFSVHWVFGHIYFWESFRSTELSLNLHFCLPHMVVYFSCWNQLIDLFNFSLTENLDTSVIILLLWKGSILKARDFTNKELLVWFKLNSI